jgi:two-component system probable response regulator PhcQ
MEHKSLGPTARPVVLFVDDDPNILEGFQDICRREPYEVLTAPSALAALDYLAKRSVDVIISDECMPRVPGLELLCRVRHEYPDVCRIMLTGEASLDASVRAINEGNLYRFLSKPLKPEELTRVIRDALRMKNLSDQRARQQAKRVD